MKFTDILGSASASLLRNKTRTILTVVAIFIGAFTIALTVGLGSGVSSYLDQQVKAVGAGDVLLVQPKATTQQSSGPKKYDPNARARTAQDQMAGFSGTLDDAALGRIGDVDGITKVTPIQMLSADYVQGTGDRYQLQVMQYTTGQSIDLAAGHGLDNGATQAQIVLSTDYVGPLGFSSDADAVGRTVTLGVSDPLRHQSTVQATVTGVANTSLLDGGYLYVNDALAQGLLAVSQKGLPEAQTHLYGAAIAYMDTSTDQARITAIKADLAKAGFTGQTVADRIGIVKQIFSAITIVLVFFGAIALVAASFGVINTLYMAVSDRTKEIGLMKAMGMRRGRVFSLFSIEAVLLGFWGSLFGVLAAAAAGGLINDIAAKSFLKDLPGFALTAFPVGPMLVIMAIIMLITFLAGTLPARRAARLNAIDALRYE